MNVLFINKFLDKEAIYRVPLGIMSLSAMIKDRHTTKIVDPEKQDVDRVIDSFKPGIIAYSLRTGYHWYYLELNKQLKQKYNFISVFGGPHVTFYSDVIQSDGVDVIGFGEADDSFKELVDLISDNKEYTNAHNFWFKTSEGIIKNSKKPLVRNLDDYPFPDRDLFNEHESINISRVQSFIASRGCPFECAYYFNAGMAKEYKGQVVA